MFLFEHCLLALFKQSSGPPFCHTFEFVLPVAGLSNILMKSFTTGILTSDKEDCTRYILSLIIDHFVFRKLSVAARIWDLKGRLSREPRGQSNGNCHVYSYEITEKLLSHQSSCQEVENIRATSSRLNDHINKDVGCKGVGQLGARGLNTHDFIPSVGGLRSER